ncbi:hypothetical protein C0Z10_06605 [Acidipropionibacterium jensenii]|uniref:Uncharacterized protein n=1 Tax=Acidipropionibacterium jensenii TaxID=1749 RepID=A0A3T0RZE7_9ACTN|nr:hypothetical protein [Acidipropionibacterium jensenii]AZZ39473.1 hypothetical protein C0Z10_06605 [Acidipropionibacterium jensenii]
MSARAWILAAAGAALAVSAGTVAVRASRLKELPPSRLPAVRESPDIRLRYLRLTEQIGDLASQAADFVRVVRTESAAKESELRTRLGLDEQH